MKLTRSAQIIPADDHCQAPETRETDLDDNDGDLDIGCGEAKI